MFVHGCMDYQGYRLFGVVELDQVEVGKDSCGQHWSHGEVDLLACTIADGIAIGTYQAAEVLSVYIHLSGSMTDVE